MFSTSFLKFLSYACFPVDLQSNVSHFGEGAPILGFMLAVSFLCPVFASALATITSCSAAFVTSMADWIIVCVIASCSVAILAYLPGCLKITFLCLSTY